MKKTSVFLIASSLVLTAGAVLSYKAQSKTIEPYQIETALENNNDYILGRNLLRANDARGAANLISNVGYQIRANSDTKDLRFVAGVKLDETDEGGYTLPGSFGFHIAYSVNSKNFDKYIEVNNFYNSFVAGNKIYTNDETAVGTVEDGKTNVSISEFGDYTHFIFLSVRNITSLDTVFTAQSAYKAEGEEDWSGIGDTKYTSYEKKSAMDAGENFYVVNDDTANLKTYKGGTYVANVGDSVTRYENGQKGETFTEVPKAKTIEDYYGTWVDQYKNSFTISDAGLSMGDHTFEIYGFVDGKSFSYMDGWEQTIVILGNGNLSYSGQEYTRQGESENPEGPGVPDVPDTPVNPGKTIEDYYGTWKDQYGDIVTISDAGWIDESGIPCPISHFKADESFQIDVGWLDTITIQADGTLKYNMKVFTKQGGLEDIETPTTPDEPETGCAWSDYLGSYVSSNGDEFELTETGMVWKSGQYNGQTHIILSFEGGRFVVEDKNYTRITYTVTNDGSIESDYQTYRKKNGGSGEGVVIDPNAEPWMSFIGTWVSDDDTFEIREDGKVDLGYTKMPIVSSSETEIICDNGWGGFDHLTIRPDGTIEYYSHIYVRVN